MKFKSLLLFLFFSTVGFCQLNDFSIQTTITNQGCSNSGKIKTEIQNGTLSASNVYKIFKLPNIIIPIQGSNTSEPQFIATGLEAGDYKVVVTQTLGNATLSKETSVTILNQIVDLTYSLLKDDSSTCNQTGSIVVNVLTGNADTYFLYQNNQLVVTQTTNEFTNLSAGIYLVRIKDICGNIVPQVYNLILTPSSLSISNSSNPTFTSSCNNITVSNTITPSIGTNLAYPLTVIYTVHLPNNVPAIISSQIFTTGSSDLLNLSKDFPVNNEAFTFDLSVTDNCNRIALSPGNIIDPNPKVVLSDKVAKCGKLLTVAVSNFSPNYTISFLESPLDFVATTSNPLHPGPFASASNEYGDLNNRVPFGWYHVQIVDACGRTAISNRFEIKDIPLIPSKGGVNKGCNSLFGNIYIALPNNRKIVSAQIIITAPPAFLISNTLPYNLVSSINANGVLFAVNLPIGLYHIKFIDECGVIYEVDVTIPPSVTKPFVASTLPNCDSGIGSIKITSGNGALTSAIVTNAPPAYLIQHPVPYNISAYISTGILSINNLPEGDYVFICKDICGNEATISSKVEGYRRAQSGEGIVVTRNCGSFDIKVSDTSNGTSSQTYWLQVQNSITLAWHHPNTGVVYDETIIPSALNSIELTNNVTLYNLTKIGNFRIIKVFQSYNDGNMGGGMKNCKETLGEFQFTSGLRIKGVYSSDCPGGGALSAVILDAEGVAPYHFTIYMKDDLPYTLDNGTNNTFLNLQPGKYDFLIEDFCTATKTSTYTVGTLPKLTQAFQANPPPICKVDNSQADFFDLTTQESTILGAQDPNYYKVIYYLSQNDADSQTNPITNPVNFLTVQNPQTIFARVNHKIVLSCYATTSFKIYIGKIPTLDPSPPIYICDGVPKKIYADVNNYYDNYEWSTGEKTFGITVDQPGVYTVTAKNIYGIQQSCPSMPKSIIVNKSSKPIFEKFETIDWTVEDNSIIVFVGQGYGSWLYSLDGINYQTDNVFSGLKPDLYKVYIKDDNECGEIDKDVVLLNYVKFFTPNGDGINDKWQIKFSKQEPDLNVEIFDRYGKAITVLNANNDGWDGTYNGVPLPSTDYWFVVNRQDGKVYKGHFSMER
ncbi:MAG: T9SS type B sorting domain-containing protein [Flavobacterium sp.]|nr:T9SS type B sorting domain-containing protein [Flavobacterium sp.]